MVRLSLLKNFLLAARPKTLPAAIVPVWVGCALAWHVAGRMDWLLAGCTLAGALCIQVATNFFNDAIDAGKGADTIERLGPVRVTASGLLSKKQVYLGAALFLVLTVAFGWPLAAARGWPIVLIGVVSMYLSYGYTGGPFPLAHKGLGELFVILFFGLVAVGGTVFIQLGLWTWGAGVTGLQVGLLSAVLISINNIRDAVEDQMSGKRTLAVRFGIAAGQRLVGIMIAAAFGLSLAGPLFGLLWLPILCLPLLGGGWLLARTVRRTEPGVEYNRYLAMAALMLLGFAVAFTVAVLAP